MKTRGFVLGLEGVLRLPVGSTGSLGQKAHFENLAGVSPLIGRERPGAAVNPGDEMVHSSFPKGGGWLMGAAFWPFQGLVSGANRPVALIKPFNVFGPV